MVRREGGSLPPAEAPANLAGAVYGQILVLSVVAGLSEDESLYGNRGEIDTRFAGRHTRPMADASPMTRAITPQPRLVRLRDGLKHVFLGDWHPALRDPLDLFRVSFPVGAAIFALGGDWNGAVRLLLPGVAVLAVRALNIPRPIDWIFCVAMFFQGWGNALHLFSQFWWYDNTVHITLPMSLAPILYIAFSRLDVVPDPAERVGRKPQLAGMALVTACLGVTAASFYEIYEWVVDHWFAQHLFIGETDTVTDLADGFLGAGIGGLLLATWALSRYTSRRVSRPIRLGRRSRARHGEAAG